MKMKVLVAIGLVLVLAGCGVQDAVPGGVPEGESVGQIGQAFSDPVIRDAIKENPMLQAVLPEDELDSILNGAASIASDPETAADRLLQVDDDRIVLLGQTLPPLPTWDNLFGE